MKMRDPKYRAKLTVELVRDYRRKHAHGQISPREVAEYHGMAYESARKMLVGDTWRHVGDALTPEQESILVKESAERLLKVQAEVEAVVLAAEEKKKNLREGLLGERKDELAPISQATLDHAKAFGVGSDE